VKTGQTSLSVVQVNYACDKRLTEPDALLDRYFTLTGWSEALLRAGAGAVATVQRFSRDARVTRNGVDYIFCRAGIPAAVAARRPDVAHVNGLTFPVQTWRLRRALDPACAIIVQVTRTAVRSAARRSSGCSAARRAAQWTRFSLRPTSTRRRGGAPASSRPISRRTK